MQISIITSTYNAGDHLIESLNSLFKQSYKNIQHLVIDGGSTDNTLSILSSNLRDNSCLISESDNGIYDALNKGIVRASGDVIGVLHADDIFSNSTVLERVAQYFSDFPDVDIVIGDVVFAQSSKSNKVIRKYSSSTFRVWLLRFGFMPAHTATFIRRRVFDQVGLYDSSYKSAGDFELFVRIFMKYNLRTIFINETLVQMSTGGTSTSGWKSQWRSTVEILRALRENGVYSNLFFVLLRLPVKFANLIIFRFYNFFINYFKIS